MEMVQVHRDHKGTSRYLETALERVRSMAARWGADGDALIDTLWQQYASRSKLLGLWVGLKDGEVVAHCVADIRTWDGKPVVWVLQVETDEPITRAYRDLVLATVDEWALGAAKALGVTLERHMMSTPHMKDAWLRHCGYTPYRMLMERPISHRRAP